MTSKERAYLRKLAQGIDPVLHVGKNIVTPEFTQAVEEALEARELIKLNVLKNCMGDIRDIAETLADRTNSQVVSVMGRKFVLYRKAKDSKYNSIGEFTL